MYRLVRLTVAIVLAPIHRWAVSEAPGCDDQRPARWLTSPCVPDEGLRML